MSRKVSIAERFENYVDRIPWSGCWLWNKGVNNTGYGTTCVEGKWKLSHRLSWEFHYGDIPVGMSVLHKCDVRSCVNPLHLFLGTQSDNVRDRQEKGRIYRQPSQSCINGHSAIAENVYYTDGHRYCLLCKRESRRRLKS